MSHVNIDNDISESIDEVEELRKADAFFGTLLDVEVAWRDRQVFLQSRGYMLRPRLRPGWQPSWRSPGKVFSLCEDSLPLPARTHLVDARRIADGKMVYIKRVQTDDGESSIASYLSGDPFQVEDPRNHSVPVLDYFKDDVEPSISYMVMPFLSSMNEPEFETVGEIVDFCSQMLEGLVFIHEKGVAHRDIDWKNLMFDSSPIFPQGHHPIFERYLPNLVTPAPRLSRTAAGGVKYYFVDYGLSSYFPPGTPSPWLVLGTAGRDREVPELSNEVPYDPFKVDIFQMGNVFRHTLYDEYSNLGFLEPMMDIMLQPNPDARPTAVQAWRKWLDVRRGISAVHHVWRLRPRKEPVVATVVLDTISLVRSGYNGMRWAMGW